MKRSFALVLALIAVPLVAGEYSTISPGLQVDFSKVNTTYIPFQSKAGNIQGADAELMFGVGISAHIRLGEVVAQRFSSLVLIPSMDFRIGRDNTKQSFANFSWYGTDGSVTEIQNAKAERVTTTQHITLSVPLRWYVGSSAAYGGFFVEAGPVFAQIRQTVDLSVDGLVLSIPTNLNESAKITNNTSGFVGGIGFTTIYRKAQMSYGLAYTMLQKATSNGQDNNAVRLYFQWGF